MDRLDFVYKNRLEPVVISDFDKVMTMYNLLKDYKNVQLINYNPITFLVEAQTPDLLFMQYSSLSNKIVKIYNREYRLFTTLLYDNKVQVSIN